MKAPPFAHLRGTVALLIGALFGQCASAGDPDLQAKVYSAESPSFTVYAPDSGSAAYVNRLGVAVSESVGRFFRRRPDSRRISVHLVAANGWRFPGSYQTFVIPIGEVRSEIRWPPDAGNPETAKALIQASLARWSLDNLPANERLRVPSWLEAALYEQFSVEMNPPRRAHLCDVAERLGPVSIETLLRGEYGRESRSFAHNAYWFFRAIRRECGSLRQFRAMLKGFLNGADAGAQMAIVAPLVRVERHRLELWWRVAYYEASEKNSAASRTISQSRELLMRHSSFIFSRNQRDLAIPLGVIPEYVGDSTIRKAVTERLNTVTGELPRVNPVYHNAYLALGRVLQSVLEGNTDEFADRLQRFREDLRSADDVASKIAALMD